MEQHPLPSRLLSPRSPHHPVTPVSFRSPGPTQGHQQAKALLEAFLSRGRTSCESEGFFRAKRCLFLCKRDFSSTFLAVSGQQSSLESARFPFGASPEQNWNKVPCSPPQFRQYLADVASAGQVHPKYAALGQGRPRTHLPARAAHTNEAKPPVNSSMLRINLRCVSPA